MYDLLAIGDIKLDAFIAIPNASVYCKKQDATCEMAIEYGKKIPVHQAVTQVAGSAPNVAIALAKMKQSTAVASTMGDDAVYEMTLPFLQSYGVDTKHIRAKKGAKSTFAAVLNYKGESTQLVAHTDLAFSLPKVPSTNWVHVCEQGSGYETLYKKLTTAAKKHQIKISINPGVVQIKQRKKALTDLLAYTDLLFVNVREAQQLLRTKKTELPYLLSKLQSKGPNTVVITDGRNGAYAFNGEEMYFAPMFPGDRVEATGAGDAFSSGFLGAILHGHGIDIALAWGAVNSAEVVQYVGPTEGLLSHTQIKKKLNARPSYKIKAMNYAR